MAAVGTFRDNFSFVLVLFILLVIILLSFY
ncbi:sporulation protein YjcZ [Gorillibacterium sp. CAU 1737]